MKTHTAPYVAVMLIVLGTFSTVPRTPDPAVRVDSNAIGGVVTGPSGPEAGVWVIAETSELATKFVKIVVTDDQGRYLLPDLPKATDRKSTRLNSSHDQISYAVFCLKKKKNKQRDATSCNRR